MGDRTEEGDQHCSGEARAMEIHGMNEILVLSFRKQFHSLMSQELHSH